MHAEFLVIAYDVAKEKTSENARCKYITKAEFDLLGLDYVREIWLEEVNYEIVEKCSAFISSEFWKTLLIIIHVKRK